MDKFLEVLKMSPKHFYYLLIILSSILLGSVFYKRLRKEYRLLVQLLVVIFLCELSAIYLRELLSLKMAGCPEENNSICYHFLHPIQLIYYAWIYRIILNWKRLWAILLIVLSLTIGISFSIQPVCEFPSYGSLLLSLLIVILSLLTYYKMIQAPIETAIYKQAIFWFNSGNLFFYASTFIIFGYFQDYKSNNSDAPGWAYNFIKGANYVLYSCYLLTILTEINRNGKRN